MAIDKNDFLTEEKVSGILSESGLDILLSSFSLNIKKKKNVVIVCPVGETEELKNFAKYLKSYGLIELADAVFVYKKGLELVPLGINALHIKEKIPLGTSGAFFSAAYLGYSLGYDIIVVADINVFIDSKKSFVECMELAQKENKAVFPVCIAPEDANPDKAVSYNVNGFTFYPRKVFEIAGFHTPYTWRGGEDFEFLMRLIDGNLIYINRGAFVSHPRFGYTVFHKMIEKKKFYPYVAGLLKAFLFHSERNLLAGLKFIIWYVFYAFYGDVFSDSDMAMTLSKCNRFTTEYHFTDLTTKIEIKKIKEKAVFPSSFLDKISKEVRLLLSLLLSKRALIYTDEITLKISRAELLFGVVRGLLLLPFRFIQAFFCLIQWGRERKKVVYPVTTKNADEAIAIYEKLIKEKKL